MTQQNNPTTKSVHSHSLVTRILLGASIGLILISAFLLKAGTPDPEWGWGPYYMVRPLLVVPFAGAVGGLFFHMMDFLRYRGGWRRIVANIISVLVFIFGLWMGSVLGLDGTYWD